MKIRNKRTGEVKEISPDEASKYGISTPTQKKEKSTIEKVAGAMPIALGTAGGVGGSILGSIGGSAIPGAGTAAGGIYGGGIGTGLGTAAGGAVKNTILDLFGKQDKQPIEQVGETAKESALAGAIDVGTGGVLGLGGKMLGTVGRSVGKVVDDIPLKSIRFRPSQITKWTKKFGDDLSEWMVNKGLLGENAIEIAEKSASQLQDEFDNLALNENITIPLDKLKKRFAQEIADLAGATKEGVKERIVPEFNEGIAKKVLDEWSNILDQTKQMGIDDLTPKMLTEMRRAIDEVIPDSAFIDPSVKNVSMRIRNILNDVIRDGVDEKLIGEGTKNSLKTLGRELSKYYDFLKYAEKQSGLGRGSLLANLPRLLATMAGTGAGAAAGGAPGAVMGAGAGIAGETLLRDPNVLKTIYKGGQAVKGAAPAVGRVVDPILDAIIGGGSAATATELVK